MASKTFGRFLLKTFGILAFCAVSGYALFLAFGYNVDLQGRHIEKTSIIDVVSRYPEVRVYLDDKIIGNSLPLQIKDLLPGFYNLSVNKLGFLPWSRKLEVQTDFVTKVDDVVLVPENPDALLQQLVHFPEQSRYFYGKDFFIVLSPGHDYLTLVYLLNEGKIKEEELKLSRQDIRDVEVYSSQNFLITFDDDTYEWVQFGGPRFVDFELPKGSEGLTFLASQNTAFFRFNGDLYRIPVDDLPMLTPKNLAPYLAFKSVDQFDVHEGKILYISKGMVYSSDLQGKNLRLIDRSRTVGNMRFIPFTSAAGGLFVVRTLDNKRLLYAVNDRGISTLLTPELKDEVYQNQSGHVLFSDGSGNIFLYKPLLKKKILVATLPDDFSLLGFIYDDGHFLFVRKEQVFLADGTYTNVYPLSAYQKDTRYFLQNGGIFSLIDHKLKSLFFLPKN